MGEAWDVLVCKYCGKTIGRRSRRYNPREDRSGRSVEISCEECSKRWHEIEIRVKEKFIEFFNKNMKKFIKELPITTGNLATLVATFFVNYNYYNNYELEKWSIDTTNGYPKIIFHTKEGFEITIKIIPTGYKIQ